ncbi:ankyrin repeat-containing protein [Colletotrichum karsti]|uniref:Ankyrin repeat-containing protein n=1 Tax=Colletotrichum karsti TaxID=1095194 RepID=A0A9P6IBW1_9PEZI|nr:ankyrin repeat-containing protein [Colletotrichum karsti]KAF9877671.1 ankyrin repeat-containing protein [Colletotrichum karsti]
MIFLTTNSLDFVHLPNGAEAPYAVLSHTWGPEEVLYKDLVADKEQAKQKAGFSKVREACRIARGEGLQYIWIDTCCTDRADAKELDESINSSFRLFRSAALCIAHLSDVDLPTLPSLTFPVITALDGQHTHLRHSRWFTRSWTLQELIAPTHLAFYSRRWEYLGRRSQISSLLFEITGIDPYVLEGGSLANVSVARRMLWAASRNATRLEDLAYSLNGLFDVAIPPEYGEGDAKAFLRLQEAILMKIKDPSIFAWRDDWAEKYSTWDKCEELVKSPHLRDFLAKSPAYFSHVGPLFPPLGVQNEGLGQEEDLDDWDTSSVASFESSSTLVGSAASGPAQSGLSKAISFLVNNEKLIPLFVAAVHQQGVGTSDRLRRNLARLLRRLGQELVIEATTKEETQSAVFLRQYRVPIASAVTMRVSEKYLKPVILQPSEESGMSEEKDAPVTAIGAEVQKNDLELDEEDEAENGEVEDSEPTQGGKEESADVDFGNISTFIHNSFAFEKMARALSEFVNPTFHSQAAKMVTKILEGKDMSDSYWGAMRTKMQVILTELKESRPERILVDVESTPTRLDRIQVWLETISGENWDWRPLPSPKHKMSSSEVRVGWQCFRRFQGGIAHLGLGLPEPDKKDYYFYPRPAQHDPPVSPEEFRHIYNQILEKTQELPYDSADGVDDTVDCIPQRYLYLNERGKAREQFWGLYVQERRSALMTSVYILLCLSPFLIFCVLYLLGLIEGDLQNATTPLALALTALGLFLGSMIKT